MRMKLGDRTITVVPVPHERKTKYRDVVTGSLYDWDELTPPGHDTKVSALADQVSALQVDVRIGITATHVIRSSHE